MSNDDKTKGIKRRTLVAGTAWAVPAVTIAAPAMAYQLSGNLITATGEASKLQGNSCCASIPSCPYYVQGYRYYFNVANPPGKDACIVIKAVTVGGVNVPTFEVWRSDNTLATGCCGQTPVTHSFLVPASTNTTIAIDLDFDNSANSTVQVTYDVRNAAGCAVDFANQQTSVAVGTPPTQGNCAPF